MHRSGGAESIRVVDYHPKAEQEIRQLAPPIRERVRRAIELLQKDPLTGKPLLGRLKGLRSRRVGEYRIVYLLEDQTQPKKLFILHVGPRGGVYPQAWRQRT